MKTVKAFTLVELLVVIAIVAIIAAILFPVLNSAKRASQASSDASNEHQIGLAMAMYANDHDDILPNGISMNVALLGLNSPRYFNQLHPYISDPLVFKSPLDNGIGIFDFNYAWQPNEFPTAFGSFGTSYFFNGPNYPSVVSLASFAHPSTSVALYDGSGAWIPGQNVSPVNLTLTQWGDQDFKAYRYNVLFFDWHIKNLSHDQLSEAGPL